MVGDHFVDYWQTITFLLPPDSGHTSYRHAYCHTISVDMDLVISTTYDNKNSVFVCSCHKMHVKDQLILLTAPIIVWRNNANSREHFIDSWSPLNRLHIHCDARRKLILNKTNKVQSSTHREYVCLPYKSMSGHTTYFIRDKHSWLNGPVVPLDITFIWVQRMTNCQYE